MEKLEKFQAELAKRILKWPKHFSNTAATTALELATMRCRVLERKLEFLKQVVGGDVGGPSVRVREALSDDLSSLCLVRECEELEEAMITNYTENILRGDVAESREMKEDVRNNDRKRLLGQCEEKSPLIAEVAREVGWRNLWDTCLSFGWKHTTGLQKQCRIMSHYGRGQYPCPLCICAGACC